MSKKLDIEFIRAEFKKEGYELLTKIYKNAHQKLDYICPEGHRHSISWGNWKQGGRCPCFSNLMKPTIEYIRSEFEKEGYTLLTRVYKNTKQKLKYKCPRGHIHSVTWSHWNSKEKRRCPYCDGQGKPTIEFIRSEFAKEGYILLTKMYKNNKIKLDYICSRGHRHKVRWSDWNSKKKYKCPCCAGNVKLNIEFIRAEFEKEGYILLTKIYRNNSQKLRYICSKGHKHTVSWGHWNSKEKRRCPYCSNPISKWEKVIKKFVDKLSVGYIPNDRTQLISPKTGYNLELDMWMPQLNKAIECNGVYWHSRERVIKKDEIKQQLCKNQGIDLLVVTDKEWNEDVGECKNKIQEFLC